MGKVVLYSDTHFHPYAKLSTIKAGINSRLLEQIITIEQFSKQLDKKDIVIFLGDFLHAQGSSIDRDTYHAAYSVFETVAEKCQELIIIPGNHDVVKNSVKVLRPLRKIALVVDKPMIYTRKGDSFYCIPYTSKRNEFLGMLNYLCKTEVGKGEGNILCGHVGVRGATVGVNEYLTKEDILPDDILNYMDIAVLGHYHKKQTIHKHIHYVGSPYQIDFSEMGIEKGYMTWDGSTLEFKKLLGPQFWTVIIKKPDDLSRFLENRRETDYYKLIVRTKKINEQDLLFDSNIIVIKEYKIRTKEKRVQMVAGDPIQLVDYYVNHTETDLDKSRIKDEALDIWRKREITRN